MNSITGLPDLRPGHWCYYIQEDQDPATYGGFVPSVVVRDEDGHWPLLGRGVGASPWVWGMTLAQAQAVCDEMNAKMHLTPLDVAKIVASSMRAGHAGRRWPRKGT